MLSQRKGKHHIVNECAYVHCNEAVQSHGVASKLDCRFSWSSHLNLIPIQNSHSYTPIMPALQASPFTRRVWNSTITRVIPLECYVHLRFLPCFALCGDMLTTAHGLHTARSVPMCQVSTVVVHACISRSCCSRAAAAKFAYSCSSGFLGKRTT